MRLHMNRIIILIAIIIGALVILSNYSRLKTWDLYRRNDPRELKMLSKRYSINGYFHTERSRITKVIILTYYRSGSSFFGEIFKNNKEILYMYEPLKFLEVKYGNLNLQIVGQPFLREILNCNFESSTFLDICKESYKMAWKNIFKANNISDIFDRCKNRSLKVAKIIRLNDLELLASYFGSDTAIIHLMRDPRGVFNSRKSLSVKHAPNQTPHQFRIADITNTCKSIVMNMKFIATLRDSVYKHPIDGPIVKQYKYNEYAYDPLNTAKGVYETLNMSLPTAVEKWIDDHTKITTDHDASSTKRNSSSVPTRWMHELNKNIIHEIQNISYCAEAIKMMGFEIMN
ncbi:unnamed protein product [Owenia fusiformis]|uniref:Sulfotransferase domain-containing protein n=1 Tax=Owenia fusiformis TaxID=6347 RepID=A0A8S4N3V0_OWEFU|nr:unnamed protein product [Owenia fusiformis]